MSVTRQWKILLIFASDLLVMWSPGPALLLKLMHIKLLFVNACIM